MDSEDMLYILYTSGTTGKPKGIVHTTGGYLTGTMATTKAVFDLKDDDVYWCTADIGWVTGHSYVVYGPLAAGATLLMYEGAPDWPERDRFWSLIERHGVTIFYTAPTAIRAFMRWGTELPQKHDLSSIRLLGSVGEPINPEAWMWYHEFIGGKRCPIVDTWWQTETGQIMITPLPGLTTTKPGSATHPFPGISVQIRNERGEPVTEGGGLLTINKPWPAMLRGIYGDPERYAATYWSKWKDGAYFAGDGARVDADGCIWLLGRVDDVLNVSGHRIGTMEVESALVDHPAVAEAAVVGRTHDIKGQSITAFVTLKDGQRPSTGLEHELRQHVVKKIGALARPEEIHFAADLPKTRSGKIMRRLLRDIAEGKAIGDTTTLADPNVVAKLKSQYETPGRLTHCGRRGPANRVPGSRVPGRYRGPAGTLIQRGRERGRPPPVRRRVERRHRRAALASCGMPCSPRRQEPGPVWPGAPSRSCWESDPAASNGLASHVLGAERPGFAVCEVVPPVTYALAGRHRFATYQLVFRIDQRGPGQSRLTAETFATFPGTAGRLYRMFLMDAKLHALVMWSMVRRIRRRAEATLRRQGALSS